MLRAEQGDIIKINGTANPAMVVSNNFFNTSGMAVVCPIMKTAIPGPLHIELQDCPVEGYVLCEQVKYVDLTARGFSKVCTMHYFDVINISDAVMGIFDYQVI